MLQLCTVRATSPSSFHADCRSLLEGRAVRPPRDKKLTVSQLQKLQLGWFSVKSPLVGTIGIPLFSLVLFVIACLGFPIMSATRAVVDVFQFQLELACLAK